MQLINKQNDTAFSRFDLIQHGFETFLKFSSEFCACYERTEVKRKNRSVFKVIRHIAADYTQSKPLGYCRFAHARLTYEARVVFGLARQYPDNVPYFLVPAYNRVELALPCPFGKVGAVFFKDIIGSFRVIRFYSLIASYLFKRFKHLSRGDTLLGQHTLYGIVRVLQNAEQQMLDRYIIVLHLAGKLLRLVKCFVELT